MHISIKMRKELFQTVEIPEGIEANVEGALVTIKGPEGELKREFKVFGLEFDKKDNAIVVGSKKATKMEKKMMNTIVAHIKNMIKGVKEKFEYTLKIAHSHFPFTVKVEGNKAIIKNFLGEKVDRHVKIPEGVEVNAGKEIITIKALDKELAGQAAANFEKATKIRKKDRRIFQDGIFMLTKGGKEI